MKAKVSNIVNTNRHELYTVLPLKTPYLLTCVMRVILNVSFAQFSTLIKNFRFGKCAWTMICSVK